MYATHSTHKTLTALRQGSMIHVYDQDFERRVKGAFHDAYMTHTSTSPNYQILASLDVGRRQAELEGYGFVEQSLELAMTLRQRLRADPLISRYLEVLGPKEMVPGEFRPSDIEAYYEPDRGFSAIEQPWATDEFVLDPTRVTLHVGRTGMDGDTFKKLLMERFDIHINKTSRNTVLFLIHIGMSRGTVAHLIKVLHAIATEIDTRLARASIGERQLHDASVRSLTVDLPPLPNFSAFHDVFRASPESESPEGDLRAAFFLAYDERNCDHVRLEDVPNLLGSRPLVSATFVTPYPPGFPVLVPGQIITKEIIAYLGALDVKEIHGFDPRHGVRIFTEAALAEQARTSAQVRHATQPIVRPAIGAS